MKEIKEVYEKFKHLHKLFCDPEITNREQLPEAAQYEFWMAIKNTIETHRSWDEEAVYNCLTETLGVRDTTDGDRRKFAQALTKTFQPPEMGEIEWPKEETTTFSGHQSYCDGWNSAITACKKAVAKRK